MKKISAKTSPGFYIFEETAALFDTLPTTTAGELIQAMARYKLRGETPGDADPVLQAIFMSEKMRMDADAERYRKRCEANAANGRKGGRPRKASETEQKPTKPKESERFFEKPKESEKSQHNTTQHNTTQHNPSISVTPANFDTFWQAYPRKVKKVDARKVWDKIAPEKFGDIMAGLNRWKRSDQWTRDGGKYIPYPATWLRAEQWEDEVQTNEKRPASYDSEAYRKKAQEPIEYRRTS